MPVEEHAPHELTRKQGHREHCWNNRAKKASGFWAQDGWKLIGELSELFYAPNFIWVEDRMSGLCRQPGGHEPNAGCVGCQHLGEDIEYENRQGRTG